MIDRYSFLNYLGTECIGHSQDYNKFERTIMIKPLGKDEVDAFAKINELIDKVNFLESLFDKQFEISQHQIELWQGLQKAAEGKDNNA